MFVTYRGGASFDDAALLMPGMPIPTCVIRPADHYSNGTSFFDWMQDFAIGNATMTKRDWEVSAREGVERTVRAGVTAIADVVTPQDALPQLLVSGLSGSFYFEACYIDTPRWKEQREDFLAVVDGILAEPRGAGSTLGSAPHAVHLWHGGRAGSGAYRARAGCVVTCIWRRRGMRTPTFARAKALSVMSTSASIPHSSCLTAAAANRPPSRWIAGGLLGADSHVAHGVHLDSADRALLRDRGTSVALCPRSNDRIGAGEAPHIGPNGTRSRSAPIRSLRRRISMGGGTSLFA